MVPKGRIIWQVVFVNAPCNQIILVGIEIVGLWTIIVGFSKFDLFDAALKISSLKGVVEFKFTFW